MMIRGNQLLEEDVRVAGFNIVLLKGITAPLFITAISIIAVFIFVTGGDGFIFRICQERSSKNELKHKLKGYEEECS